LSYLGVLRLRGYSADRNDAGNGSRNQDGRFAAGYAWLRINAMKFWSSCSDRFGNAGIPAPPCMACERMRSSGKSSGVRPASCGPIPPLKSAP